MWLCVFVCESVCESVFQPFCVWTARTYFDETHHSGSLLGPHDIDDIVKFMGSEVEVTEIL